MIGQLPGVGRKTAKVVLSMAFWPADHGCRHPYFPPWQPAWPCSRQTPEQVEQKLLKAIPEPYLYHAHHWLILHGRYVCKARKPNVNAASSPTCANRRKSGQLNSASGFHFVPQPFKRSGLQPAGITALSQYDVLTIGNAIVDIIARTDDDFLVANGIIKGAMKPD